MAEGGYQKLLCSSCDEKGQITKAIFSCLACELYLCSACKKTHSEVQSVKSHKIIGKKEVTSMSSLTVGSESTITPVCKIHDQVFEWFCKKDMTEICETCKLMEHSSCKDDIPMKVAAGEIFSNSHGENILRSLEDILSLFEQYKTILENNKEKNVNQTQLALDRVRQVRTIFYNYFNELEAAAVAEIQTVSEKEMKHITHTLHTCETSMNLLSKRKLDLERLMPVDEKEAWFIAVNRATKDTIICCEKLHELTQKSTETEIKFDPSESTEHLKDLITSMGSVSFTKVPKRHRFARTFPLYTGEMKLKTETDKNNPYITSYKVLHDGRKLLADNSNRKLKLYNAKNQFLTELGCPDNPWNIVLLSNTEAVVSSSVLTESLLYITIDKDLTLTNPEKTDFQLFAMAKYGNDMIATISDESDYTIAVLDQRGKIKTVLHKEDTSIFKKPDLIDLSADHKTLYIADSQKTGCFVINLEEDSNTKILGMGLNGTSGGLAVGDDCLFIAVDNGSFLEIKRVSFNDEIEDLDLRASRPLKVTGKELVVFSKETNGDSLLRFYFLP